VEKYLSTLTGDHEVPALTTGEHKESFRRIFLIDDHGGGAKLPMFGDGKHSLEFVLRQSRQKAWPKPIGKADILVSGREFADTIHKILFSAHSATFNEERRYPIFHGHLGQTTAIFTAIVFCDSKKTMTKLQRDLVKDNSLARPKT
jgi:hypothetical protein